MTKIDFHCHLDFESFDKDRINLIKELEKEKIIIFTNTLSPNNYKYTKKIFENINSKNVEICPGLYPQNAEKISDEEFKSYLELLESKKNEFKVIGEVGLDKHNTTDEKLFQIQVKRFKQIIEFAIKINKPLCIHARKAEKEVLEILEYYINKTGFKKFNLHCFSGKKKLIKKINELKIFCSIPLIILNTESFKILVKELNTTQILVETDSPFLNPTKTRNTPLNIPKIYEKIAEIKGYDKIEIENIIYSNYNRLIL